MYVQNRGKSYAFLNLFMKLLNNVDGNAVYTFIVVSVFREVAFHFKVDCNAVFVADWFYFRIFNGARESATTLKPAMPVAIVRRMFVS